MFIRRIFYNTETGEILREYMMSGDLKPLTAEQEAERFGLENWAVMEWRDPDPETEQNFTDSYGRVSVDLSGDDPVLNFDFSPLPVEETEADDMKNALSILGVEVESNG